MNRTSQQSVNNYNEPCSVCAAVGGYCGGSGEPSCGCFDDNGNPLSRNEWDRMEAEHIAAADAEGVEGCSTLGFPYCAPRLFSISKNKEE